MKWSQRIRGLREDIVDEAREYDLMWRKKVKILDELRHQRNLLAKEIGKARGEERKRLIDKSRELSARINELEKEVNELRMRRDRILLSIPNIVHESVPRGESEEENMAVRYFGRPKVWKGHIDLFKEQTRGFNVEFEVIDRRPIGHADMGVKLGLIDTEKAGKVAGARFYYLFEDLVWLDMALILYSIDHMVKKGFVLVEPPVMLRRAAYEGVTALSDFEEMIYKVENEDLYLIATSEHPIAAMYMNEVIPINELPLKYVGISPCFRKEAGAHGKDTKGIFRVHQFNKVEQFVFCLPEESWRWHEILLENAIELWRGLELPFRVVNICSGELGVVAAKKYDIEVWMPAQGRFREVVSCSNCLDYQSYRLNIRYAPFRGAPSEGYVHTLNSTAIATGRAITAILENNQLEDGSVVIPKVLRRYLEPFEPAPKDVIKPLRSKGKNRS
ncbi:serine--tRNA ligase [Candidatus Geothermarchaeota archaeon]|nr:MAG: serine--tRNA ligase [Candidatus Geothermarchaeota archaeon]